MSYAKLLKRLAVVACLVSFMFLLSPHVALAADPTTTPSTDTSPCTAGSGSFLGLPTWYQYLPGKRTGTTCVPQLHTRSVNGQEQADLTGIWLVGLAVIEVILRLVGLIAVGYVIFGGFKYITSQGQPDATKGARQTIINAFVGLVIVVISAVSVDFIAKLLSPNSTSNSSQLATNLPQGSPGADTITRVLQFVFALAGAIAMLVIAIAGFRYTISRGDPAAVKTAKDSIIYAIVGLVIAIAGYSIVTFVLGALIK